MFEKLFRSRKGFSIGDVPNLGIVLVVIAVVLGVGSTVLTQVQSTQTVNGIAYNVSTQGLTGITTLASWQNTWAVIISASVVVGIIYLYLMNRGN